MYAVHVLIPTARFVFSVEGEVVEVLPEHRSPQAHAAYGRLRDERPVVGMTTFPNSLLLRGDRERGEPTILVDPGLQLQNAPVIKALDALGLGVGDVDLVALTHAHDDHACACVDLPLPVAVHEAEVGAPHWPVVAGILGAREMRLLEGDAGELAPGVRWVLTPGHTAGGVTFAVDAEDGVTAICGDIVGPSRDAFDAMEPEPGPDAADLLASWRRIRALAPRRLVAGHLPPFDL